MYQSKSYVLNSSSGPWFTGYCIFNVHFGICDKILWQYDPLRSHYDPQVLHLKQLPWAPSKCRCLHPTSIPELPSHASKIQNVGFYMVLRGITALWCGHWTSMNINVVTELIRIVLRHHKDPLNLTGAEALDHANGLGGHCHTTPQKLPHFL